MLSAQPSTHQHAPTLYSPGLLDSLFEQTRYAILILEPVREADGRIADFRYVRLNQMAQQLLQLPACEAQLPGQPIGQTASAAGFSQSLLPAMLRAPFVPVKGQPTDATETVFDRYARYMDEGGRLTHEITLAGNRSSRTFVIDATPLPDGLLVSIADETENRRRDDQLSQQQQLLHCLLAQSENGTIVLEAVRQPGPDGEPGPVVDFMCRVWNDAALRISSLTNEQVREQPVSRFRSNFQTVLLPLFTHVLETGQSSRQEYVYKPHGRWMNMSLSRLDADHLIMMTTDIHDIKMSQQEAEQQANLLALMLETTKANITLYEPIRDADGQIVNFRYVFTNASNARATGRTVAEMTGGLILDMFPGIQHSDFYPKLLHTAQTGEPTHLLFQYHKDGVSGWFDIDFVKQGQNVLFTSLDVTALKNAQLDLLRSNDYLQQFAYVASHDLQEPLRKIQSFSDMLMTKYASDLSTAGIDMLARMQRAARRMSDLVHDLLAYSQLATQQTPFGPVNLHDVFQDVLADLDLTIRTSNAQVSVHSLPTVMGDPGQLRQLFQNLISNALKYVDAGRPPVIRVTSRPISRDELVGPLAPTTAPGQRQFYQICVEDNGIGFDEQYLERIFQMFQRLHGRFEFNGSGMGLAICQRVVENHQGSITARSRVGEGATFIVCLPG